MFDFLTAATLQTQDFNDQTEFLIDGFLAKNLITMVYADGGNGKSWLGLALAKYCAELRMQIVYLDFDNPLSVLQERGVDQTLVARYRNVQYVQRSKSKLTAIELLSELAINATANVYDNVLIVLDSLRNFGDVNAESRMMHVMTHLMDIREAGATIVVLHHSNKDGKNYQGSNHIRNSVDNMFQLKKFDIAGGIGMLLKVQKERAAITDQAFEICPSTLAIIPRSLVEAQSTDEDLDFINEVQATLRNQPGLNKTDLLNAIGFNKDDKTARARLDKFDGIHWHSVKRGNRYGYQLIMVAATPQPQ
ncbi:AAA family ATPase [Neptunicella sp. SCSIO 80796]|uniref:AAA family ATPase n=1 Tax=Neptunicella plasticusilytica TaxID=3117012 RepID=UPI003A4D4265